MKKKRRSIVAPGYEADCSRCVFRKRVESGIKICTVYGVMNPRFIACCHCRTRHDTPETIARRREQRKQFWMQTYEEKTETKNKGYDYKSIAPKYRKYIGAD